MPSHSPANGCTALARVIAAIGLLCAHALAAPPSTSTRDAADAAYAILTTLHQESGAPAISAAVAAEGRIIWADAVGLADLELRAPAGPDTVYRLASISKAITGVAIAWLVEQGRLDLDAPIDTYLEGCPEHWRGITTRMLMAHTAGIRSYTPEERDDLNPKRRDTVEEALAMFRDDPLVHPPGERFTYTTLGYIVVRAIIEAITGTRFIDYLTAEVLGPAGMFDTHADDNRAVIPNRAAFYHGPQEPVDWDALPLHRIANAPYIDTSYKPAGGGLVGTAPDLCRLMLALQEHRLLKPETRELMWAPTLSTSGERYDYGLGWGLALDARNRFFAVQTGGQIGTGSAVMLYPDSGVGASLISNRAATPIGRAEVVALAQLFEDAATGVSAAQPDDLPDGHYTVTITDEAATPARVWSGVLVLGRRLGDAAGELSVVSTADATDRRRFRIACATHARAHDFRLFTVHARWGIFCFDLTDRGDEITGTLDRPGDRPWTIAARRLARPQLETAPEQPSGSLAPSNPSPR